MLHAWKHVALRDDDTWLGPWPAERARELQFIEEFGGQWKAAQKMQVCVCMCVWDSWFVRLSSCSQSVVRGRRARRLAAALREENLRQWVARKLQARFRARKCRRAYILRLMKRRTEHEVATRLQTRFRMRVARREVERLKHLRYLKRCNDAATKMQV